MRKTSLVLGLLACACGDDGGGGEVDGRLNGDGSPVVDGGPADGPGTPDGAPIVCEPVSGTPELMLEDIGGSYNDPILLVSPPTDNRLFVVERAGVIRIAGGGTFLDLGPTGEALVRSDGSEEGLLGLAFHPDYGANRRSFVYYIDGGGDIQIDEFTTQSGDPNAADLSSRRPILSITHRISTGNEDNHNGGMMAFGSDGYLYISTGDGGFGDDPDENAQNTGVLLGKLLRIDVDSTGAGNYGIPAGNPFGDEIWAYGLRNPWRFSVDRGTGDLYIGDVGQDRIEEIDVAPAGMAGLNFGWDVYEGTLCNDQTVEDCVTDPEINDPTKEWPISTHDRNVAAAIIGGFVYRGCKMPDYHGTYFFGYLSTGQVFSLRWNGSSATDEREWLSLDPASNISAFGQDYEGEVYVIAYNDGAIYKIVPVP